MTSLRALLERTQPARPWDDGDNIPWDDPDFSERMLELHLDQSTDLSSRRSELIARHVEWIHGAVLNGAAARVLDLACGPGLYTSRLAELGCECTGIDFAPAAIRHARQAARARALRCTYEQQDLRQAEFGDDFDLVMLLYGQLNVFRRDELRDILARAYRATKPGGQLLLEPQTYFQIRGTGERTSSWYTAEKGLFSERPHAVLQEGTWSPSEQSRTERFYVVDLDRGDVTLHALTSVAYSVEELTTILETTGFSDIRTFASLHGAPDPEQDHTAVVLARR